MLARFYCAELGPGRQIRLQDPEAGHLSRVCRLGAGDRVELFDGRGAAFESRVTGVGGNWVDLVTSETLVPDRPPPFSLVLASAVPKGDRFDWVVEKATELGVERLIPLVTERSVAEPGTAKLARLRRTIIESSKQCRRNRLMVLDPPMRFTQLIGSFADSRRFVADPQGDPARTIAPIGAHQAVVLAVGPEGGLTPEERELAGAAGWRSISLSSNVLRIETAAIAGCAVLFSRGQELNE